MNYLLFNVAIANKEKFLSLFKAQQIDGGYTERSAFWVTKSWIPEAFIADIANSNILYEKNNLYSNISDSAKIYPDRLKNMIMHRCQQEILHKIGPMCSSEIDNLDAYLIRSDIVSALIRYAFAYDKIYFRGFHKIDKQSKKLGSFAQNILLVASNGMALNGKMLKKEIETLKII